MKSQLRGIFLTAEKVERTAHFYQTVAGLDLQPIGDADTYIYWKLDTNGLQLAIHDAAKFADYSHPVCPDSNVTHLYLTVADQGAFLVHLNQLNITPYAIDDVVVTMVDPDGRKVMFGTA